MLCHLALPRDWEAAQQTGFYTTSTLGASIDEVGFMHCSDSLEQAARVAAFLYEGVPGQVLLLELDREALEAAGMSVVAEAHSSRDPNSEKFPHVYGGPLPVAAVAEVRSFTTVEELVRAGGISIGSH